MTRGRILPPEEAERAIAAGGPLQELQVNADRLREMSIAVAEVDGEIVGYWVVWYALHAEPLWIRPDHRHTPGVVTGLIGAMQEIVEGSGEPVAYCEIAEENLAVVGRGAERLGFAPAPGKLYYLVLQPAVEPVGV